MTKTPAPTPDAILQALPSGITAIEAANSLEFLRAAFDCYDKGQVFAITRADVDPARYGVPVTTQHHDSETRGWVQLGHSVSHSDDPAQIVFTSGTEGLPKAIVLTHRNLGNVVTRLNDIMQVTDEIREYIGVPVTYSFGLGRARAVSAAGGAFFIPERFDPSEIRAMLEAGEINAISAVPSLWRVILNAPDVIGVAGAKLRWIEIGSQYMSGAEKQALRALFPNARIVQHYGMTEASRSTFLVVSEETDLNRLEAVGPADDTVRINAEGAIEIRGDHVSPGRLDADGTLSPLVGDDSWFTSSDRGEVRDGMLYYLGRMDDQMNLGGIKVGAEALEARVGELVPASVGHFALTSVPDSMRGEVVMLALEAPASEMRDLVTAATLQALKDKDISAGGSLRVITADPLPRTATGKIQRASLRTEDARAETATSAPHDATVDLTETETRIAALWTQILGDVQITPQASFFDSGGDSLSGLQVGLVMEGADMPRNVVQTTFEGASLRDVAALLDQSGSEDTGPAALPKALPDRTRLTWGLTLTRALVVLAVLISHWGPAALKLVGLPQTMFIAFTRIGTPGFAFMFGIGVGLYMLPEMARASRAVFYRIDRAVWLIGAGVALMTATYLSYFYMRGDQMNWLTISNAIYSVLIYYLIMLLSARLWLPLVARMSAPLPMLLFLALALWGGWQIMETWMPSNQFVSPLELARLMFGVGGYNVFKLGAMTAAGIAAGVWIARQQDVEVVKQRLLLVGGLGVLFCGTALLQTHGLILFQRSTPMHTSLLGLAFYGNVCLFSMGACLALLPGWARMGGLARVVLRVALAFGGLALPIYVFHQLVIPAHKILEIAGLNSAVSTGLPLAVFFAVMFYMGRRIYRMYGS